MRMGDVTRSFEVELNGKIKGNGGFSNRQDKIFYLENLVKFWSQKPLI